MKRGPPLPPLVEDLRHEAIVGEEDLWVGYTFVVDEVAAHGFAVDDDAMGEAVGEAAEVEVLRRDEFAMAEVAGDDGGEAAEAAGDGGEDAGGQVVGVDEANAVLAGITPELGDAGEGGAVAEGAHVEAGDGDGGGAEFVGAPAFVKAGDVGSELPAVDGESELGEVAFAAPAHGEFAHHEQDGGGTT